MFFTRLLGLTAECEEQVKEEEKFLTCKLVTLENKRIGIEVEQRGIKEILTPEQICASFLKKVHQFYLNAGINTRDLVISVPSYFSAAER